MLAKVSDTWRHEKALTDFGDGANMLTAALKAENRCVQNLCIESCGTSIRGVAGLSSE
jgi:hypothetical protein